MRIDPKATIAGVKLVAVRDFLRQHMDSGFTVQRLMRRLRLGREAADALADALAREGRIERHEHIRDLWVTTVAGNALAMATAAQPVRRQVAERNLEELLGRVRRVNAEPGALYWVTKVTLFGSMLDRDQERVNDVDVAVEYRPRLPQEQHHDAMLDYAQRQERQGRRAQNFTAYVAWAEIDLRKELKAGSRVLSVHYDDPILGQTPHEVVYTFEPPSP
jgi:predicted nucleotidyltransferase